MTSKKPKTFEEKVNAILRYNQYIYGDWRKARFLPKFAYLPDDELESLLHVGKGIEQYAIAVAQSLFPFGGTHTEYTEGYEGKCENLRAAIVEKYPYLDKIRADRLVGLACQWVFT